MNRLARYAPLTGLIFTVLFILSTVVGSSEPNANWSGTRVITFFTAHRTAERAGAVIGTLTAAFLIFFAGALYSRIRETDSRALGVVALVGAGILATGLLVADSITWALTDHPASYSAASAHALNAVSYNMILPLIAGMILFGVSLGIAVVRGSWLPSWLGWVLIALGIIAPSPAFPVAAIGLVVWSAVVALTLSVRTGGSAAAQTSLSHAAA